VGAAVTRRKKKRRPRERDWDAKHEDAFTHDLAKHRRADRWDLAPGQTAPIPPEALEPNAVVIAHSRRWAFVRLGDNEHLCAIDEALQPNRASLLAPGDQVHVNLEHEPPIVRGLARRRSKLSRLAHAQSRLVEQVIAANVDVLVVVASATRPRFKPGVVDRFLISAAVGGVDPLLVVNKMDLVQAEPDAIGWYRDIELTVINTSCVTHQGIDALRAALLGKQAVMAGQSGVGKSSLLNAIDPALQVLTQEVSASTDKGRHTTAASHLYLLEGDIRVIDTPGLRQLGLWGVSPEELAFYFPEFDELAPGCRFRNCTHVHEPECAVRAAVEAGEIPKRRYQSYRRIRDSL